MTCAWNAVVTKVRYWVSKEWDGGSGVFLGNSEGGGSVWAWTSHIWEINPISPIILAIIPLFSRGGSRRPRIWKLQSRTHPPDEDHWGGWGEGGRSPQTNIGICGRCCANTINGVEWCLFTHTEENVVLRLTKQHHAHDCLLIIICPYKRAN